MIEPGAHVHEGLRDAILEARFLPGKRPVTGRLAEESRG